MNKGVVIHIDNDKEKILNPSKNLFDQNGIDLEYIICSNKEEFDNAIKEHSSRLKALIFDLLSEEPTSGEINQKDAAFLEYVRKSFVRYNIPIFIYSGFLQALNNEFSNHGTVFEIDKSKSIQNVFDLIKFFMDSGFIDLFCPGGILENEIKDELHNSFINQFSNNSQITEVIESIKSSNSAADYSSRVKSVFKRITVKALASDLLAPVADKEDKVNPIEHFYKRQSKLKIWTGDIWRNKTTNMNVLVLTPRCDFAMGESKTLIFCVIEESPKIKLTGTAVEIEKRLRDYLTDNIQGKAKRYIPATIFFPEGGMANLALHYTITNENFIKEFDYVVTLSDDLTNEIIGKFAYYFLRTGITNIEEKEFEAIIKRLNP